jgi:tRNA uridine 5-carboxymethylaminomethyl modification enzyme
VAKQQSDVERAAKAESTLIPGDFDADAVRALSCEVRQILKTRRPRTIGEAARLPGVTPAAVSLLLVHVKKHRRDDAAELGSEPLRADA